MGRETGKGVGIPTILGSGVFHFRDELGLASLKKSFQCVNT